MKRIILILLFFLFGLKTFSQNLICDGSFEDTTNLWDLRGGSGSAQQALYCWKDAYAGFVDYYNQALSIQNILYNYAENGVPNCGVPINFSTNFRMPRSGIGYIGINVMIKNYYDNDTCIDTELVFTKLRMHFEKSKCYKVRLYVGATFRRFSYAIDGLDVFFNNSGDDYWLGDTSDDTLKQYCRCNFVPNNNLDESFYPQLSSPQGVFFSDTIGWQKVEFEYNANGDESYMYLGLLRNPCNEVNIMNYPVTINSLSFFNSAYLFFDDVSVYPCDAPEYPADIGIKDTCINKGSPIVLGGLPKEEYLYWWYDANDSLISRQSSITVYPTKDTSFVLVQKDFKFDETRDTVHIKVGNCLPLPPDYSGYDFAIYPNPNYGDFQVRFNTNVPEGAVLELYDLLGRKLAEYPLSGSGNIANINGIEVASAIYYATVVVPNSFRKSVKMVIMK